MRIALRTTVFALIGAAVGAALDLIAAYGIVRLFDDISISMLVHKEIKVS